MVVKESKNLRHTLKKSESRKFFPSGYCHFFSTGHMCAYFQVEWREAVHWESSKQEKQGYYWVQKRKGAACGNQSREEGAPL